MRLRRLATAITLFVAVGLWIVPVSAQAPEPTPIIDAVLQDLSQRLGRTVERRAAGVSVDWVTREFPDASLGCPRPGEEYAQVITPGFQILVTVDGIAFDYRAGGSGTPIVLCDLPTQSATPVEAPTLLPVTASPGATLEPAQFSLPLAFVGPDGNVYLSQVGREDPGLPVTGDANRRLFGVFPFWESDRQYGQFQWSSDGAGLLFVDSVEQTLWLIRTGQAPQVVARGLVPGMPGAWSPDGTEIAYPVPTDPDPDGEQMTVQIQALPLAGGAPRYAGEFAYRLGCEGEPNSPSAALYAAETGFGGSRQMFFWTERGFVHTMACDGSGLALTDFAGQMLWNQTGIAQAAAAQDGLRVAGVNVNANIGQRELVIVALADGNISALETPAEPAQVAWSWNNDALLFSSTVPETPVAGDPASTVGVALFPESWPIESQSNTVSLWRIALDGGQAERLIEIPGIFGIGHIAPGYPPISSSPAPDAPPYFSIIDSTARMIQAINLGDGASRALMLTPRVRVATIDPDTGALATLWEGGQPQFSPSFLGLFDVVPAPITPFYAAATSTAATPEAIVCEGALPARLTVGASARALSDTNVRIRNAPDLTAPQVGSIPAGAQFDVMSGPSCIDGVVWWGVQYDNRIGWAAEAFGGNYLVEPAQ